MTGAGCKWISVKIKVRVKIRSRQGHASKHGRAGQGIAVFTRQGQVRSGHIETLHGRGLALKVKVKVMEDRKEDAGQGKGYQGQGEGVFCSVLFLVPAIRTSKTVPNLANTSSRSFLVV